MGVYQYDKTNDELKLIAGGVLYADAPVGTIVAYGGTTPPSGWLICQGQELERVDFAELFAVIGTAFGTPSGDNKFKLPDLRESVPKGTGLTGNSNTHLDSNGLALGEFIDDRLKTHSVGNKATGISGTLAHTHNVKINQVGVSGGGIIINYPTSSGQSNLATTSANPDSVSIIDPKHSHSYSGGATTEVKSVGVNYIIKAKQIGAPADFTANLPQVRYYPYITINNISIPAETGTIDVNDNTQSQQKFTADMDGLITIYCTGRIKLSNLPNTPCSPFIVSIVEDRTNATGQLSRSIAKESLVYTTDNDTVHFTLNATMNTHALTDYYLRIENLNGASATLGNVTFRTSLITPFTQVT